MPSTVLADAAPDTAPNTGLATVAALVRDAAGMLIRRARQESGTSLTWSQSVRLSGSARHGRASASQLAAENGLQPQMVWSSLATLAVRGLVDRERTGDGRRNVYASLTPRGRAELDRDRRVRKEWIAGSLLWDFTAGERAVLEAAAPLLVRLGASGHHGPGRPGPRTADREENP